MTTDRQFPTTIWEGISSARKGDARELDLLLGRYRAPITGFLRWKGSTEHEAEDLAQEVLLRVSQPGFLQKVDPSKGRFRSLLLAVTRHVISEHARHENAERRGGSARVLHESEMAETTANLYEQAAAPSADDSVFDQLWVSELVARALHGLEEDANARSTPVAAAFRLKYLEGLTQEQVAERLGCTVFNAKNYVYYGKLKFKQKLLESIKAYCTTPEEFDLEVRRLAPYWKGDDA